MLENALDTTALQHLYAIRWCNRRWGHIICSLMQIAQFSKASAIKWRISRQGSGCLPIGEHNDDTTKTSILNCSGRYGASPETEINRT